MDLRDTTGPFRLPGTVAPPMRDTPRARIGGCREPRVRRYHWIGVSRGPSSETPGVQPTRSVDAGDAASGGLLHRRAGDRRRDPRATFAADDDDFMPALWIRPSPTPQRHRLSRVRNRGGTHRPGPGGRSGPTELPGVRPPARESPMERDLPRMRPRQRGDATVSTTSKTGLVHAGSNSSIRPRLGLAAGRDLPDDHRPRVRLRRPAVSGP